MNSQAQPEQLSAELESLVDKFDGDLDFVRDLAATYRDQIDAALAELQRKIFDEDLEPLARQAHALKGASANMEFGAMRTSFFDLEKAGREGDVVACERALVQIRDRYTEVRTALTELIES